MDFQEKKVEFEVDGLFAQQRRRPESISGLPRLVIKYLNGYVKNEKQANYFLIAFAMIILLITVCIWLFGFRENKQRESRLTIDQLIIKTNAPR